MTQGREESTKKFINRFLWLKEESGVGDAEAKDLLLSHLNSASLKYLEGKLEAMIDAGSLPAASTADSIPFSTLAQLLNRDPILQAYPPKPHQLSLAVKAPKPAANQSSSVSQIFASLPRGDLQVSAPPPS